MSSITPFRSLDEIRARSTDAVLAQSGLAHAGFAAEIRRRFGGREALGGGLLAEPVIEAAPDYTRADRTFGEFAGTLLHPATVAALDGSDDPRQDRYRFPRDRRPFEHQVEAWRVLADPAVNRSVLVSSGTGSGKTECFLVPILDHLVRAAEHGPLVGIEAVILYPLNALIASQEERLRDWTAPFEGKIRFALYNSLLQQEEPADIARLRPETVADRKSLRAAPPPILVTNVTMLEYMLLRREDAPILAQSQGHLRYIVLDEAHSYIGAQAAEIALLLRRVCIAFGVRPSEVRFIATSATIGGADADSELRGFLADVSGTPAERVTVIWGKPHWPDLPPPRHDASPLTESVLTDAHEADLFELLACNPSVRPLLDALRHKPMRWADLEAMATKLGLSPDLLAMAVARARRPDTRRAETEALSPLRVHGFLRAVPGLWSCLSPACSGARPKDWPFGAIACDDSVSCKDCGGDTFEIVACHECGEPYLDVLETGGRLSRSTRARPDDEFAADREAESSDGNDEADDEDISSPALTGIPRLLAVRDFPAARPLHVALGTTRVHDGPGEGRRTLRAIDREAPDHCIACKGKARPGGAHLIRPFRFGAPFLLGNAAPILLEGAASAERHGGEPSRPMAGRQLLSFTDSRQGTARFAAKLQIGSERNFVRSFIYHAVQDALKQQPDTSGLDDKIGKLRKAVAAGAADLQDMLNELVRDRAAKVDIGAKGIAWPDLEWRLAERPEIHDWMRALWEPRDQRFQDPVKLARFLLLREFFRRPRRANTIETLGFARLRFASIDDISDAKIPRSFVELGGAARDWRDFLSIVLTYLIRANSAVRVGWNDKHWIQPRVSLTEYVPATKENRERWERAWPAIPQGSRPLNRLTRPVVLLSQGLSLPLDDPTARAAIQEWLDKAMDALATPLLPPGAVKRQLDFSTAHVAAVTRGFLCPVTHRVLDVAFRGFSPYGAGEATAEPRAADPIDLPRHPLPFLGESEAADPETARDYVADWLASDPAIVGLREHGVWSNLSDRIALFSPYFRSAEHSAQQPPHRLRHYETEFKAGRINILNCSTTMEMGVDIGSVSHVMMTNVPPSLASYRQRVGRAGRRRQAVAMAFTFCRDRPLDRAAFRDPIAFLSRAVRAPRVALDSEVIVQRHVNALVFSAFVHQLSGDALKMQASGFFGCPSGAKAAEQPDNAAAQLIEFARRPSTRAALDSNMAQLTRGSALEGDAEILDRAADLMMNLREDFAREWRALQELRGRRSDDDGAANRGLEIQLRRLCEDYLLSVLSTRGFLPGHGFPSGVVSFLCRGDPPKSQNSGEERARFNAYPQRALDVALREYAPGAEIVLDGLVHRSEGVTLNWRRPASADGVREIQNLLWRWRCPQCGESGSQRTKDAPFCASCGSAEITWRQYLEPAGFAADPRAEPHADPDEISHIAPQAPTVTARGATWIALADPIQGRRRATRGGSVFYANAGQGRNGYTLCLSCGRAKESGTETAEADRAAGWIHKPLLGKAGVSGDCVGAHLPFSVKHGLWLGHEITTDVFELQAADIGSRGAYLALAVALRESLARRLSVEPEAMGVAVAQRGGMAGSCFSLFIFDRATGGAGFASQAETLLAEILPEAANILDCKIPGCRTGCPACVLTGDLNEDEAEGLDRFAALDGARRLGANAAPRDEDRAHPEARLVADAGDVLERDSKGATRTVLRLAGSIEPAGLMSWRAPDWVRKSTGPVIVSAPLGAIDALDGAARLALRDSAARWGVTLEEASDIVLSNGAHVIAEIVRRDRTVVLATRDLGAFAANGGWGRPTTAPVVRFEQFSAFPVGKPIQIDRLLPPTGAALQDINGDCDGAMRGFGSRLAALIGNVLKQAGAPTEARIVAIAYSDRYLNSPIVVRLAIDTFSHLVRSRTAGPVTLRLRSTALRLNDSAPCQVVHDWKFEDDRKSVTTGYAKRVGFEIELNCSGDVPHGRRLTMTYSNGAEVDVYFDQGFGTWRPVRRTEFRFDLPAAAQLDNLARIDMGVISNGKTYLVGHVRPK